MTVAFKLFFLVIHLNTLLTVDGCGTIQAGLERNVSFTLTNLKLAAVMVYSEESADKIKVPTISISKNEAEAFVRRLIMNSVEDVLYQQGRSAFLSDTVISLILQQFEVQINYEPLKCENVITMPLMNNNGAMANKLNCIIVDGGVTSTCMHMTQNECSMAAMIVNNLKPIDPKHLTIAGSFKTSNAIMASWSNQMWESVLNRVLRSITSSSNGSSFQSASIKLT